MTPFANRWCVAVLLSGAVFFFSTSSLARQSARVTVVVHVYNNAKISPSVLAETGSYVRKTFDRIGVGIIWVDEMSRLHAANTTPSIENAWSESSTAHVSIAVVSQGERMDSRLKKEGMAMGRTPGGQTARSYVFSDRVEAFVLKYVSRVSALRVPRVLAYAIEHELGHLLIPSLAHAHSERGIMKAQLGAGDLAPLFLDGTGFSAKEGELMTDEIQRRINIQAQATDR